MFGKNRNKKVGLCVMVVTACLIMAGLWTVLATPETALAHKTGEEHSHGGGKDKNGGGERTAMVTISGPMQTEVEQTFEIAKDSEQTLELNRGSWTEWGAVPIRYAFDQTVDGVFEGDDLMGHLVDSVPGETLDTFPARWDIIIQVDMSNLTVNNSSTTNKKGGHSIDIWTDPDQTPTITDTPERLWIPEGPNKSGPVTVKWVSDDEVDGKRVRVFEFTSQFKIQVVSYPKGSEKKDKPRKIMRCDNLDGPITVTVVTTP